LAPGVATGFEGRLVEVEPSEVAASAATACAAESKAFRAYDPDQVLLMSPVLAEWVPEGDLAHFVADLVEDVLDLSAIYASYEEVRGFPPYDPRLMVKVLVYGYANGVCSSRKLERATYRDVAIRMLCAGQHPDYRSIARFRARHLDALSELFVQALRLCWKAGLVKLGSLALDGTKLRANASRRKAMSYERMVNKESQLEAEIAGLRARARALLEEAEATDAAEDELYGADVRGDELPAELARRETRLVKLRDAKAALEAEAKQREEARREAMRAEGREPRDPSGGRDAFAPKAAAQRNFTDPESKIMKASDGAFHQSYNAQAIVDAHAQVIVAAELSNQAPDCPQLAGALDQLDENLAVIDAVLPAGATLAADAGYLSAENIATTTAHGLDAHIATGRQKHSDPPPLAPRGRIPNDATPRQRMARKLKTKKGRAVYARRKVIVEPVFGQMQTVQDAKRLLLRGEDAARAQWRFHCAVHNLLKFHRAGGLALITPT
jgi:transposase